MAKSNRNSGKLWSDKDISALKQLVKGNTPTRQPLGAGADRSEAGHGGKPLLQGSQTAQVGG